MNYLEILSKQIHTVIAATTDEQNLPITCAIDIMDYDEKHLYFLTAKGKNFYKRLVNKKYLALTGLHGSTTMSSIAISLKAKVVEIGQESLLNLFEKNPYMFDIYPSESARKALTVFKMYNIQGEYFDLTKKPIERASFNYSEKNEHSAQSEKKYSISNLCNACGLCLSACPQECIDLTKKPAEILQKHCLYCGNCYNICPEKAVLYE